MSLSKAQKKRRHRMRQGHPDPERKRGQDPAFSMHERTTVSKQTKLAKARRKEDQRRIADSVSERHP